MSFNLGQYRRDKNTSYTISLDGSIINIPTETGSEATTFEDKAIQFTTPLTNGHNFYIKLAIKRLQMADEYEGNNNLVEQKISVYLQNSNEANDLQQFLGTYFIPRKDPTLSEDENTSILELIVSPNGEFDQLAFILQRTPADYQIEHTGHPELNNKEIIGRRMTMVLEEKYEIRNIIDIISGVSAFNKIGVQGPPGMLMCINGEDIRIGPSGIYEINNGYKITFLGFIVKSSPYAPDQLDYFIVDYQYPDTKEG